MNLARVRQLAAYPFIYTYNTLLYNARQVPTWFIRGNLALPQDKLDFFLRYIALPHAIVVGGALAGRTIHYLTLTSRNRWRVFRIREFVIKGGLFGMLASTIVCGPLVTLLTQAYWQIYVPPPYSFYGPFMWGLVHIYDFISLFADPERWATGRRD